LKFVSKFFSAVLHPLLMPTYSSVLFFLYVPDVFSPIPYETIPYFLGAILLTTGVVPAISILFLRLSRKISNLEVTNREERTLPFISILLFYAITTYMFKTQLNVPSFFVTTMVIITVLILIIAIISLFFKISVHSAAIWGVLGILVAYNVKFPAPNLVVPISILCVLAGVTTSSRISLNLHTEQESWFGVILGFFICFLGFYFLV